jgi:dihydroflavonol-4-reductase
VGALGNPGNGTPGTEATPVSIAEMVGHYKRSKFLAEEVALEFAQKGLPLVVVNPSTPVGPWDWRPTPTGQMVVDYLLGRMPAYLETGLNLVHVQDVARGHLLAEEKGRVGEKYILGHENLSLSQIFQMLAEISGIPAPTVPLAYINEFWAKHISRGAPRMTVTAVRMAKKFMYFDSTKAVQELGYSPTPVRRALEEAVEWFQKNGYVS